jgi:KDO2-lipid IV(A) lauroyltransferase
MKYLRKKIKHVVEYIFIALLYKIFRKIGYEKSSHFMGKVTESLIKHLPIFERMCSDIRTSSLKIPASKIKKIALASINNFGRYIAEFEFIHTWTKEEFDKYVKVTGLENLKNLEKKPVIILTSHHANWEIIVRYFYFRNDKVMIVNRSMNNPYVNKLIFNIRSIRKNFEYVDKNSASKKLIEGIKNKYFIGMLADVKLPGIKMPFLGREAMCTDVIARLYDKYKVNIIPCSVTRVKDIQFILAFHPKMDFGKLVNDENPYQEITREVNNVYERWIAENPEQWYWIHNRWKA